MQQEILRLPSVLLQNASVMDDLQHSQSIASKAINHSSSQRAQLNGEDTLAEAFEAFGVSAGSRSDSTETEASTSPSLGATPRPTIVRSVPVIEQRFAGKYNIPQQQNEDQSSVISIITAGSAAVPSDLESTASAPMQFTTDASAADADAMNTASNSTGIIMTSATTAATSAKNNNKTTNASTYRNAARSIIQPLCSFADALEHSTVKLSPSSKDFYKQLSLKKVSSSDLILAQHLDFDECESPRSRESSIVDTRLKTAPRLSGSCLEYAIAADGSPLAVKPLDEEVHQFAPMSPTLGREEGEGKVVDESGSGRILVLKGEMSPSQKEKLLLQKRR